MSTAVFPNGGRSVVEQMCERFPELHVNDDEKQRQLTTRIQEQFAYQWGGHWGGKKRTGLSDSQKSKDSMAYLESSGLCSTWDMFQGNAEATILVVDGQPPNFPDQPQSEATFMAVAGRDWLGVPSPGPGPGPGPEPAEDEILATLHAMQAQQAQDTGQILALDNFNTDRILTRLNEIVEQFEKSLKEILVIYLAMNRPGEGVGEPDEPIVPPGGEGDGLSELQKFVLTWLIQNRPASR